MTSKEQNTINDLFALVSKLRNEKTEATVDKKNIPLSLEENIMNAAKNSMADAIKSAFTGYSNPLEKYAKEAAEKHQHSIKATFEKMISEGIVSVDFENACKEQLLRKIAKTVISGIDGSVDKVVNQMKQDSVFRSKLTLMVNNLIEEYLAK
ncbi:MAG: hypothetical protein GY870_04980 [archaeon]|nr:hypothetical protein [archaeon]